MSSIAVLSDPAVATPLSAAVEQHLRYSLGRLEGPGSAYELFRSVGLALRPRILDALLETERRYRAHGAKRVYYLSMEFLIGQSLRNNLHNLGVFDEANEAVRMLQGRLEDVFEAEPDAALGNGGLGRLAACFLESLATLNMPGHGYGINYDYGLFRQKIQHGYQREEPDFWHSKESPWLLARPDQSCLVPLYGRVSQEGPPEEHRWVDWKLVVGQPHDVPIVGYGGHTVNYLRLYSAQASEHFNLGVFNQGDYFRAIQDKIDSEKISKILYPSDVLAAGRELRLLQEYFLVACAVRDIVDRFAAEHEDFRLFPSKVAIQLNDTHPALTVAELMRHFVDERKIPWEQAWEMTCETCAYTNHTLLPEALERWSAGLIGHLLPRHLQIIQDINSRFLAEVSRKWPDDMNRLRELSIFEEGGDQQVRMAHLALVGSHAINGVAELHSELLKTQLLPGFSELWPDKFQNKTNGVTHRRWLVYANPDLARLITESIGPAWVSYLYELQDLQEFAGDSAFQDRFLAIKHRNKSRLADVIASLCGVRVSPESVFDVQIKRMHEYKRQLLHVLQVIAAYFSITEDGATLPAPVTHIFAGKAAPGYAMAKLIVKLINNVASVVNHDPRVREQLRVVFLPDYRVSLAEKIIPGANISEQISTAGMEASGTGNMKLAMNGALTLGTLDGANVEIQQEVGPENITIFGLTAPEVHALTTTYSYQPWRYYQENGTIRRVMDSLSGDFFCKDEPGLFRPIFEKLLSGGDHYLHLADLQAYIDAKMSMLDDYRNERFWARKSVMNVARSGRFSSDRTIREYAQEIWRIQSYRE